MYPGLMSGVGCRDGVQARLSMDTMKWVVKGLFGVPGCRHRRHSTHQMWGHLPLKLTNWTTGITPRVGIVLSCFVQLT